jgi:predicted KAP-like P-loop ATPase
MWHDNEATIDLLGFERFAIAVDQLVSNPAVLPLTVGLFGDWGSGKSSVLRMIEKRFEKREDAVCLRFDGWLFEGYDDAKAALMSSIIEGLREKRSLTGKLLEHATSLAKRVNWFRAMSFAAKGMLALNPQLIGLPPGTATGGLPDLKEADDLIKPAKEPEDSALFHSIREFRLEFESLLKETKVLPLVVLIDDLDRCFPPSIVSTLEAIRLFLAVPGTAFVIAADERIVHHAIAQRFPPEQYREEDLPQAYLEKLVQVRTVLPSLDPIEVEVYIYLLFAQLHLADDNFAALVTKTSKNRKDASLILPMNYGIAKGVLGESAAQIESDFTLAQTIAPVLADGLQGNPRQIKRFLNTFFLRLQMAQAMNVSLEPTVLAKLMILERFHEERFKELFRWQNEQDGVPSQLQQLEAQADQETKLSDSEKLWQADPALCAWLALTPPLSDVNLSPYFRLARETLRATSQAGRKLPEELQQLLANLLSDSDTTRKSAAKSAGVKPYAEAAPLFDTLWSRALSSPKRENALDGLFEWANQNEAVAKRLVQDLQNFAFPLVAPKRAFSVMRLAQAFPSLKHLCAALVFAWEEKGTGKLKKAAKEALKRAGEE